MAVATGVAGFVSSLHLNLQIFWISTVLVYDMHFRRRLLIRSMRNETRMRNLGSLSKLAIAKARCDRLCIQASLILKDKFSDYHLTPRLFSIISQKIHIITSVFGTDNSLTVGHYGKFTNMFTKSNTMLCTSFLFIFSAWIYAPRDRSSMTSRRCTIFPTWFLKIHVVTFHS